LPSGSGRAGYGPARPSTSDPARSTGNTRRHASPDSVHSTRTPARHLLPRSFLLDCRTSCISSSAATINATGENPATAIRTGTGTGSPGGGSSAVPTFAATLTARPPSSASHGRNPACSPERLRTYITSEPATISPSADNGSSHDRQP